MWVSTPFTGNTSTETTTDHSQERRMITITMHVYHFWLKKNMYMMGSGDGSQGIEMRAKNLGLLVRTVLHEVNDNSKLKYYY